MDIMRNASQPSGNGPAEYFTGAGDHGARVSPAPWSSGSLADEVLDTLP